MFRRPAVLPLALAALLAAAPAALGQNSRAPTATANSTSGAPGPKEKPPVLFSAAEVQYDDELSLLVAKGNVEMSSDGRTILADIVTYNQRTDTITASGRVSLLEPTGEILSADYMELTDRMNEAFLREIRILMTDRSRMAGNTARRVAGNRTELRRGVYSPCDLCKDDPTQPPIWQIKAEKISHDQEARVVEYRDAVLEIGGFPVLYLPYISHPDPTVKRQSGLLPPTFGISSTLGTHVTAPYYWAISPDKDLTVSPMLTTEAGIGVATEYRQRFASGELKVDGSITGAKLTDRPGKSSDFEPKAVRGHVFGKGRFSIDDTWRTGFDLRRTSDQTYLRKYKFGGSDSFLTTRGFLEGFEQRSFAAINAYSFQTLRQGQQDSRQPIVLPAMEYSWLSVPDSIGSTFQFDTSLLNVYRERGTDTRRLSLGSEWRLPIRGTIGDIYTITAGVRGDAYYATDLDLSGTGTGSSFNGFDGRLFPQVAVEWRYPWIRPGNSFTQLIEPIVAIVAAPVGLNYKRIPNEDSQAFDFDESDLFVRNRFPGLDRVDSGQRIDYGLRAAIYGDGGGSSRLLIGQSYRLQNNSAFASGSGLEGKLSDIVGRISVTPLDILDLTYRFRLDRSTYKPRRQEVTATGGPPSLVVSLSYLDIPADAGTLDQEKRKQVVAGVTAALTRYWTTQATVTRTVGDNETLGSTLSAIYRDECLAFIIQVAQSAIRDRDITPGTSVVFSIVLKNLSEIGGTAFQSSAVTK